MERYTMELYVDGEQEKSAELSLQRISEITRFIENKINEEQKENKLKYESIIILKTSTSVLDIENLINEIGKKISARIDTLERVGIKKLAYEIKGQNEGYFIRLEYYASEEEIINIERQLLEKNDNVLKYIIIKSAVQTIN